MTANTCNANYAIPLTVDYIQLDSKKCVVQMTVLSPSPPRTQEWEGWYLEE